MGTAEVLEALDAVVLAGAEVVARDVAEVVAGDVAEVVAGDVLEGTIVDDGFEEELELIGCAPVPGAWYISSLYGPPQNSDELPLQSMLQPERPSGAGPFPPKKELPQSSLSLALFLDSGWQMDTHSTLQHIPSQRTSNWSGHMWLHIELPSSLPALQA